MLYCYFRCLLDNQMLMLTYLLRYLLFTLTVFNNNCISELSSSRKYLTHNVLVAWKCITHYWTHVWGIPQWPANSPNNQRASNAELWIDLSTYYSLLQKPSSKISFSSLIYSTRRSTIHNETHTKDPRFSLVPVVFNNQYELRTKYYNPQFNTFLWYENNHVCCITSVSMYKVLTKKVKSNSWKCRHLQTTKFTVLCMILPIYICDCLSKASHHNFTRMYQPSQSRTIGMRTYVFRNQASAIIFTSYQIYYKTTVVPTKIPRCTVSLPVIDSLWHNGAYGAKGLGQRWLR